jgi:hypothetical protein
MARAAEHRRLTGMDRREGASASEPPRVPRISSGLPPVDGHTMCTRERGLARQSLGPEGRIENSCLLIACVPDAREPRSLADGTTAGKSPRKTGGYGSHRAERTRRDHGRQPRRHATEDTLYNTCGSAMAFHTPPRKNTRRRITMAIGNGMLGGCPRINVYSLLILG